LLLTAAARVFARDGLAGATTRAIAREAGVNEVTLFRTFGSKEHLIAAVVGRAFGTEAAPAAPAVAGGLRADVAAFAGRYDALLVANLPLVRTMIGEIHRHADCEHQALKGIFSPLRAALVHRLELARREGEIRAAVNPEVAADLLAGMVFSAVLRRSLRPLRRSYGAAEYRRAAVEMFLRGLGP
jgi:AcrR family transcriptional regulator